MLNKLAKEMNRDESFGVNAPGEKKEGQVGSSTLHKIITVELPYVQIKSEHLNNVFVRVVTLYHIRI